jgi:transposase
VQTYLLAKPRIGGIFEGKETEMFLRAHHRTKDGKRHTYFSLVESIRTERGPRQRMVAELGELSADDQRRWQRTAIFHARHKDSRELPLLFDDGEVPSPDDDVVRVRLDKVGWTNAREFGDVWLGLQLWRMLGLEEIVSRHLPTGRETVPPATMVAIEVVSRLCVGQGGETSEFALAEQGYRRTGLDDLLGVPDEAVTKDRLYRTLDALMAAKEPIERDLKESLGTLFSLNYDLLLCDLTSSFFEGLAEMDDLAARGYSRDHRSDCKQIVLAMVVTQDGFPLYHEVFAGNTRDATALPKIVETIRLRFGSARRVWVLDRGLATQANLQYLQEHQQSFLVGTPRSQLTDFDAELATQDWQEIRDQVELKCIRRGGNTYVLARSQQRRAKERAIRRRHLIGLHRDLKALDATVSGGRLKDADKVQRRIGRLAERWPKAWPFVCVSVRQDEQRRAVGVTWTYQKARLKAALARDGAYLLLSDQAQWTAEQLWTTYIQLTRAEEAFRAMKSHLWLRPMWHQTGGRIQAHVFVCVLAYALWKALDHLLRRGGAMTRIRKPDEEGRPTSPEDRPMSPAMALKLMHGVKIGDILLETTDGRKLRLRRVARPTPEQAELLAGLKLTLPERLVADREVTEAATHADPG